MFLQTLNKFFSRKKEQKSTKETQPSSKVCSFQFTTALSGTAHLARVTPLLLTESTEMGSDRCIHTERGQGRQGYHCSGRRGDWLFSFGFWVFYFPLFLIAEPAIGVENGGGGKGRESGEQLGPITFHCRSWRDVVDRVMHRGCPS